MNSREKTRPVRIGNLQLGGQNRVLIQSMCSIKTSRVDEVSAQINRCASLGADMMRLSCLDEEDARAFQEIKRKTSIPLIADIHFDYRLALLSMDFGVDAIRINPGNVGGLDRIAAIVEKAKEKRIAIRIGVNSGSIDKTVYLGNDVVSADHLVESARKHAAILESLGFHDIVLSLKGSDVRETVAAYRLAARSFPYPLHVGITEAGPKDIGLIRSAAGIAPILLDGIGDTIRISLSDDPEEEIKACCRLLHDLGLYPDYPTFISCPTCGRTAVDLIPVANAVKAYAEEHRIPKTIAIMGCVVNGPGEARHADIGCAGGNGKWVLFKKGTPFKTVPESDIVAEMISLLEEK